MAIPGDARIEDKTLEKITKYQDLRIEVQRLMEKKATVVPVIIGAIPKDLEKHLQTLKLGKINTKSTTESSPTWNSTHPQKIPQLKFLGSRRELELQQLQSPVK